MTIITVGGILVSIGLFGLCFCMLIDYNIKWLFRVFVFSSISGIFLLFAGIVETSPKEPTALDVYQGKTTLEITYKDSVPIDTIVVFKDEFKE